MTFLKLIGFLSIFVGSELNICETFGSISFLIFRDKDLLNIAKTFFLKKWFNIFLFTFERKIFQENSSVFLLFAVFVIITATHSYYWSVTDFYFLSLQLIKNLVSYLLRVQLNISSFFVSLLFASDLFYQVLMLFWNYVLYLLLGSFKRQVTQK